ncbi:MAG: tetratricopeptide (TPR) repeat protein, partial [Flavobacteriales bacterium]
MSKFWPILLLCAAAMVYKPTAAQSFNEKLAKEYMDAGSFEKAQTLYQDLYDNKPNSANYKALLDCFVVQKDFKSTEKHIKHQLKLFNDATVYQLDLADLYLLDGKKKKSEKVISAILDEVKENPNLAASIANALFNKQKFEAALEVYKIGMGHRPSPNYLIQMAEIYAQLKDQKSFFDTYLQLQEFNPAYSGTVKNRLARATTDDPENNSNIILRELLLDRLQKGQNDLISNLLSWLFIQEKNFDTAFIQLKAIDKRQKGNQKELFQLAQVCR